MSDDEFAGVRDLLPEDALPHHSIRIVEYLNADGEPDIHVKVDGDVRLAQTIGVLEIVKSWYLRETEELDR